MSPTSSVIWNASADGSKLYATGRADIPLATVLPKRTGRLTRLRGYAVSNGPGGGTTRPTGTKYVRIEDLAAAKGYSLSDMQTNPARHQEVVTACPDGKVITYPEGVFELSDFTNGYYASLMLPKQCAGIVGSGMGTLGGTTGTIFKIRPNTMTNGKDIPTQASNGTCQQYVLKQLSPTYAVEFRQFQVAGTTQATPDTDANGYIYNNFICYHCPKGSLFQDIRSDGNFGNNGSPPGETFNFAASVDPNRAGTNAYTDPSITFDNIQTDGRRQLGGTSYSASGQTIQSSNNCMVRNCGARYCQASTWVCYLLFDTVIQDCDWDGSNVNATYADLVLGSKSGSQPNSERSSRVLFLRCKMFGHASPGGSNGVNLAHSCDNFSVNLNGVNYPSNNGTMTMQDCTYNVLTTNGKPRSISYSPYGAGDTITDDNWPKWVKADGSTSVPTTWIHGSKTFQIP